MDRVAQNGPSVSPRVSAIISGIPFVSKVPIVMRNHANINPCQGYPLQCNPTTLVPGLPPSRTVRALPAGKRPEPLPFCGPNSQSICPMFSESKEFLLFVHLFTHLFTCPALTEFPSARHGLSPGQRLGLRLKDQKDGPWGLELPGARQGGEGRASVWAGA